jgi:hypothetical protein
MVSPFVIATASIANWWTSLVPGINHESAGKPTGLAACLVSSLRRPLRSAISHRGDLQPAFTDAGVAPDRQFDDVDRQVKCRDGYVEGRMFGSLGSAGSR